MKLIPIRKAKKEEYKSGITHLHDEYAHHRSFSTSIVSLDLSAAAVSNITILHTGKPLVILDAILLYTEASSADAGVVVTIGKESSSAYYYTGTSEASKALWYEKSVVLLATDVSAGDTVVCGCAGGKTGTGEILICLEYKEI